MLRESFAAREGIKKVGNTSNFIFISLLIICSSNIYIVNWLILFDIVNLNCKLYQVLGITEVAMDCIW